MGASGRASRAAHHDDVVDITDIRLPRARSGRDPLRPAHTARPYRGESAEQRQTQRRARLVEAGVELFGTIGYQASTIDGLCAEAGLTKRYFYESFQTREDLLDAVYVHVLVRLERAVREDVLPVWTDGVDLTHTAKVALRAFYRTIRDDPRIARITLVEVIGVSERIDDVYRTAFNRFAGSNKRLFTGLEPPPGADTSLMATALSGACLHLAAAWLHNGFAAPLDTVVESMYAIYVAILDDSGARPTAGAAGTR